MKFFVIIAALCVLGGSNAQVTLDFLNQNLLNPMLEQISQNALTMLNSQLSQLIQGLFGGLGKRSLDGSALANQLLAPFINQIKETYGHLFQTFLAIIQNVGDFVQKPNVAHVRFLQAGDDARLALSNINLPLDALKPLVGQVQQHLNFLINNFDGIITQALDAAKPVQAIINNALNLLKP